MRKRERENPCAICGHFHKYEEGEVCGICGHRLIPANSGQVPGTRFSAFPSEILPEFLFLGSYDNASRSELLKTQGISRILNTVPLCQNLYKNSFTYHCLQDEKTLQFDEAIQFIDKCAKDKARVLVHCMSGKNRSPAVVIAYLMKRKGWRLPQSYQWVKDRRPSVELTPAVYQQLREYEETVFRTPEAASLTFPVFPSADTSSVLPNFGLPMINDQPLGPVFTNVSAASVFTHRPPDISPKEFVFGASQTPSQFPEAPTNSNGSDCPMDSS